MLGSHELKLVPPLQSPLNVDALLGECASSTQVECTSPVIASLIFLALDRVIGPSETIKGSLSIGTA